MDMTWVGMINQTIQEHGFWTAMFIHVLTILVIIGFPMFLIAMYKIWIDQVKWNVNKIKELTAKSYEK